MPCYDWGRLGERARGEGGVIVGSQRLACQGWLSPAVEPRHQQFRRGSELQTKQLMLKSAGDRPGWGRGAQQLHFPFYLWPGLTALGFPILLPSSWDDILSPSHPHSFHSSFCCLSALARQFHSEDMQTVKHTKAP